MKVLFVGLNPAKTSWDKGHYFSHTTSESKTSLWYQLREAGFYEKEYSEMEADQKVFVDPKNRLGITDIAHEYVESKANKVPQCEIEKGKIKLKKDIETYKPEIVCFLGKGTYRKFLGKRNKYPVEYGPQPALIKGSKVYMVVFPSAMVKTEEKIEILKGLRKS